MELTTLAFDRADHWRNPVQIYGDYLLAHTSEGVEFSREAFVPVAKEWAVDGSLGGSGRSRNINPIGMQKGSKSIDPESFWKRLQAKHDEIDASEARFESESTDDAELLVVAFGSVARFVRHVVRELRAEGVKVGYARPISLWPFPSRELAAAARGVKRIAVLEQNAGQMIDDVRLSVLGSAAVLGIGGISSDSAGFGMGPLLDSREIRGRVERALASSEVSL